MSKSFFVSDLVDGVRHGFGRVIGATTNLTDKPLRLRAWRSPTLDDLETTLWHIDGYYIRSYVVDYRPEDASAGVNAIKKPGSRSTSRSQRAQRKHRPASCRDCIDTYVLVHGIGVSSHYFLPLARELRRYGRVVMLDLPGFSDLPHPGHPLTIAGFARCADQVLQKLKITNPVMVGHSMGAQVVVELLNRRPDLADRVALIGPPVNARERSIADAALRFIQSSAFESFRLGWVATRSYLACGVSWFAETVPAMMEYPIERRIHNLRGQVLLLRGAHDQVAPSGWIKQLADECAIASVQAQVCTIDHAAHSVIFVHPAQVAAELVQLANGGLEAGAEHATAMSFGALALLSDQRRDHRLQANARADAEVAALDTEKGPLESAVRSGVAQAAEAGIVLVHSLRWARTALAEAPRWVKQLQVTHQTGTEGSVLDSGTRIPVIIIPGLTETWRNMVPLGNALHAAGHPVWHLPGVGNMEEPVADLAGRLSAFIDALGVGRVAVVAHSKGGLVGKTAMLSDTHIVRLIALGTPWSGSSLVGYLPRRWQGGKRWADLLPGAEGIFDLARRRELNDRIVSISAAYDQQIPNGTYLPRAHNLTVPIRGHQHLITSPLVAATVVEQLADLN